MCSNEEKAKKGSQDDRPLINVLQLRSSPFLGSPERLILGQLSCSRVGRYQYVIGVFDEQKRRENEFAESARRLGGPVLLLKGNLVFLFMNLRRIIRAIRTAKVDIIIANDYKSNLYAILAGSVLSIPAVAVFHGRTGKGWKGRLYERFDAFMLRYFNAVVCVSRRTADLVKKSIPRQRCIQVIPNAVDVTRIEEQSRSVAVESESKDKPSEKVIVYAGRLSKEKGVIHLVEAAKILLRRRSDVRFLILGDGPEKKQIEEAITGAGVQRSFSLLGYKSNIYPYLRSMNFLVLPSLTEGMPVVILESFALRKAVIATRVGGVPEIVEDQQSGFLVDPGDAVGLAQAMECLLENPDKATQMGNNGYCLVTTKHTFEVQVQMYTDLYRQVIAAT